MATLRLYIYSKALCVKGVFTEKYKGEGFVIDIWNTIRHCDVEYCCNTCGFLLRNTQMTRDTMAALQNKYDAKHKEVCKLTMFCISNKLLEGERLYVFDADKAKWSDRRVAMDVLEFVPPHNHISLVHNPLFTKYNALEREFDVYGYGFDRIKVNVGEVDKSKRKCRFCGSTDTKKFSNIAHAIQNSLGNKLLVCLEECDDCNHTLNAVEDNFLHIMDVRRALYGISRKNGMNCPQIIGDNFALKPDEHGKPILFLKAEKLKEEQVDETKSFHYRLNLRANITNEGVYKALVKMVIDLIPSQELVHFENTIRWLTRKDVWMPDVLPDILVGYLMPQKFYRQPALDIFLKKQVGGPYCTAVLWIYDLAYIFIVPFVDKDAGLYKYNSSLVRHWQNFLKQIPFIKQIAHQDGFEWRNTMPWVDIDIDPTAMNIRILPETDFSFKEKMTKKNLREEVMFPAFSCSKILVKKVKVHFKNLHQWQRVTDADLKDATITYDYILFDLDAKHKQISFRISYVLRDTTNKIDFFSFSAEVIFLLGAYNKYIRQKYGKKCELLSFAIDINLRDYLFAQALKAIDAKARSKMGNSDFRNCVTSKFWDQKDRLLKNSYYRLFIGNRLCVIPDKMVHQIDCQ